MQTVARQEAQLEKLARDRQDDAARHTEHVKEIYARMQREQEEALEAGLHFSLSLSLSHACLPARPPARPPAPS